ncbi:MAG TPA: response regulator, partial [Actinomycetes bacterium]|nr:response regulator [Actinomycetes bacterium]
GADLPSPLLSWPTAERGRLRRRRAAVGMKSVSPPGQVLMVDDRPDNLLALEAVLEPLGAELVRAGSGEEALRHLLSAEVAVIILDVQMPGMDGFETARLVKAREKTRNVPIIFLTAISGEAEHHLQGYRSGAVDYVYKPFNPEALRSKVSVFLDLWRHGHLVASQRQELARQLAEVERLNGELERSNAALERFAAAAAVDIEEPLDNVAGMLDLLSTRHHGGLDEQARLLVDRAQANLSRVREHVASLLEYARAAAEEVKVEQLSLADVVDEAAARLARATGVRLATGDLPTVTGDRGKLVKVFGELLDNAVRHGGTRPLTVRVDAEDGPAAVTVSVTDDGNGIPLELRPALFTLLPAGTARRAGLATCRRIVEGHGGTIWAEAAGTGRGARIRFTLPKADR